jgi:hypothetical protein
MLRILKNRASILCGLILASCTLCHQIVPGKMGLTDLGSKLSHLQLGCVDVEKQVASR